MNFPATLRAGDSVSWVESLVDFPASAGWLLKYRVLWPAAAPADIVAVPVGDEYSITLAAATTASWTAGVASVIAWVERSAERVTLEQRELTVLPNLAAVTNFDGRSQAERMLASARSALESYLAGGKAHVAEYEIDGRRMKFRSAAEIRDLIHQCEADVGRERAALALMTGGSPGRVCVRF